MRSRNSGTWPLGSWNGSAASARAFAATAARSKAGGAGVCEGVGDAEGSGVGVGVTDAAACPAGLSPETFPFPAALSPQDARVSRMARLDANNAYTM